MSQQTCNPNPRRNKKAIALKTCRKKKGEVSSSNTIKTKNTPRILESFSDQTLMKKGHAKPKEEATVKKKNFW